MHEKEILQNLARSGRLASQTHRRALTHSLLNKALRCSLIQDRNVSSNSDCQPPADANAARYDRFRQQSHFCWNCESRDGMSKNRDEHHAIKQDLQEKLHLCSYCQHRDYLPDVGSKTGRDGKRDEQQQPVIKKRCQRCMVAGDDKYFQRDSDLEDAASDDECQECMKQVTDLLHERTRGGGYMGETSDYPCDNSHGCPHCELQQGQQSVRSDTFQPIGEINMNMKVSRDDKPCSCREKGVTSLRRQLNNEWYQRNRENQGSSDCQPSRKCSCSQYIQQLSPGEASHGGKIQEHKRNYQRISGNDGQLRQSSFNMEMHRIAELWPTMSDHKHMRGSDGQIYKRSNEDQPYKGSEGRLYKRSVEDQKYKKSEDPLNKRSDNQQYKNSEDQLYERSDGQQYNKSEDRLYTRSQDPQYKDPENRKYKETNDDQHKKGGNDPLNKKPNDHPQYKRTVDQPYQKNVEDHVYRKQNNDLVNGKISDDQQYKRIDNPINTSDELQSKSPGSSQHYRKAADDIPQLPKDDQQSKSSLDELQDEQISQVQQSRPGLDAQYQKVRDFLHGNTADDEQQYKRTSFYKYLSPIDEENIEKNSDGGLDRGSSDEKNSRTSDIQEFGRNAFERTSDDQRYMRTSDNLFVRTSRDPQSEQVSHDPQSDRVSRDPQSERASHDQQYMRTRANLFVRTSDDNPQFGRVSQDQRCARTSDIQQPEEVCCDQQYMRTSDYPFVRTSDNQQFERTVYKQQCVRTSDNQQFIRSCDDQLKSSNNLYVRPSENLEIMRDRDVWQCGNNTGDQQQESREDYPGYTDSRKCKTCCDNQQYSSSSRNQQSTSHHGNMTSCNTCKCKKTDGQKSRRQMSGILIERHAQWSKMEDTQQQEKHNFDAAMKQMSLYMNSISQVCECFYDSCSKDNLSLLERRHIRMFHKGVLPVRQQPKKKSDTLSPEDICTCPSHCPCHGSVNRQRGDEPLSEERSRSRSRIPSTDRSQNFMGFSKPEPCLDPVLEDDSQMEDVFHRANKSQSARSQTTGKSQLCVRFSDTDAEINQSNKNVHCSEMSDTCISSLPSEHLLKDFHSSFASYEDGKQIQSTESASDNILNTQFDETVLADCTPSVDFSQADCKAGSLKHQTRVHKSGHKMAATTRNGCLPRQTQKTISGAHPPQGVFIEGVSAFPTKASKIVSKSSKSKVRSSRSNLEQGILIRTKPGSYIVKKPKEDSSIHLLQVNPGNYVKLNM